ncbi:murein hydrolase activator EnvC family protein [Geopsychrobacter electrodiphilus]|uniref:murein hydrolase activator EnvC family protein n=1 Tax=Geopsychrobacter electrodiphilus TaxID=225196 RepID=UPI00037762C8|nr:peptidoglycan DD-metalloendopeptidase family protein [Geopsychrobacter electrodiphilus]
MRFLLLLSLFSCFLSFPRLVSAGEQQDNRARLQQIRQRIDQANQSLNAQHQQELSLLRDLVAINTSLQEIDRRITQLKTEGRQAQKKINNLLEDINQGRQAQGAQEVLLKKRLVSLYKDNNSGLLKVLFSSSSPMELAEQYTYLSRILANDKELMATFRLVLEQQQKRLSQLKTLKKQQEQRLVAENKEGEDARSARKLQAQVLRKVRQNKTQLHAEVQKLLEKAARLENLVRELKPNQSSGSGPFASRQGKLPWPLSGGLLVGFGTQKNPEFGTLYESHGIEISAAKGTQVKAVAPGKVAFASWFKGYGNLLIVSHPGGFHTLYAQAEKLLKQVGDSVEQGDVIAVAGLPGEEGIYFEIRQNGAPVNPLNWLTPR